MNLHISAIVLVLALAAGGERAPPPGVAFAGCIGEPGLEARAQQWAQALHGRLQQSTATTEEQSLVLECHLHRQGELGFVRLRLLGADASHPLWSGSYGLEAPQQQAALAALATAVAPERQRTR